MYGPLNLINNSPKRLEIFFFGTNMTNFTQNTNKTPKNSPFWAKKRIISPYRVLTPLIILKMI